MTTRKKSKLLLVTTLKRIWLVWTFDGSFTCYKLADARKLVAEQRLAGHECVIVKYVREVKSVAKPKVKARRK